MAKAWFRNGGAQACRSQQRSAPAGIAVPRGRARASIARGVDVLVGVDAHQWPARYGSS
jgi:hypothetical protein